MRMSEWNACSSLSAVPPGWIPVQSHSTAVALLVQEPGARAAARAGKASGPNECRTTKRIRRGEKVDGRVQHQRAVETVRTLARRMSCRLATLRRSRSRSAAAFCVIAGRGEELWTSHKANNIAE
jgi:hypothetical protein